MSINRRITRSVSSELQVKAAVQGQSQAHAQASALQAKVDLAEDSANRSSNFLRNTSEEMFIRSLVEGSMGVASASMDAIGFTSLPHMMRGDSEELFHSWISGVESHGQSSTPYRRIQLASGSGNYAGMQELLPPPATEILQRQAMQGTHEIKQEFLSKGAVARSIGHGRVSQLDISAQVPQLPLPPLSMSIVETKDSVSNIVSMLKRTLERKNFANNHQRQQHKIMKDTSQEELHGGLATFQYQNTLKEDSPAQFSTITPMRNEGYRQLQMAGQMLCNGQTQVAGISGSGQINPGLLYHAPSPSDSSGGAPVLSTGDDQCNSGQTNLNQENAVKRAAHASIDVDQKPKLQSSLGNYPSPSSFGAGNSETQLESLPATDLSKKSQQTSMRSVTSSRAPGFTLDKDDPSKKRRVERQKKMAEAKGRITTPIMPSDLQATLKRCETLEKEVRSLKLNLSFMNRKDSEQTKLIEELQKENEHLQGEKERILDELEGLVSGSSPS